jgi:endogenous inhibitor of DNA gyrase (YacG/DUF329 family)
MMIKKCIECDKDFFIEIKQGSGGTSPLRKKYCSDVCKRAWKKKNGNNNFIKVICDTCGKEVLKFPSLVKNNNYCSKQCQNIALNGIQKIENKNCLVCGEEYRAITSSIVGNKKKYCSQKCSKTIKKPKTGKTINCLNCNQGFYVRKYQESTRKYCSDPCQFEAQSKGIKRIPTNGRCGFRKDLPEDQYFKSSLEADYARYLIKQNILYEYEKHTFKILVEGREAFYTPDFYLLEEDRFIELKGARDKIKYNKNLKSVESLAQTGKKIEIIYMKDFYEDLRSTGLYDTMFLEVKNYKTSISIIKE